MKKTLQELMNSIGANASQNKYWHYRKKPMPCDLDDDFHDLIRMFTQASHVERGILLSKIDLTTAGALMAFGERMAVWSVRLNSSEFLLKGLIALVIDGGHYDIRDTINVMPLLHHSAEKLNLDPQKLFDEAADYYPNDVARVLRSFPKRKPEDRSLKAFYFIEVDTPEGIDYRSG